MNVAILEIDLRCLDSRLGRFYLGLIDVHRIFLCVVVLLGNGTRADKLLIAGKLNLREIQGCRGLRKVCLRGIELRLVGTRINYEKKLALLQVLSVLEVPLGDSPCYLGCHGYRLKGDVLADLVQIPRHILRRGLGHRYERRGQRRRTGGPRISAIARGAHRQQRQQKNQNQSPASLGQRIPCRKTFERL
jgi:hypothetical protein